MSRPLTVSQEDVDLINTLKQLEAECGALSRKLNDLTADEAEHK